MSITSEVEPLAGRQLQYGQLVLLLALAGGSYIMGSIPLILTVITQDKVDHTPGGLAKETVSKSLTLYWVGWAASQLLLVPLADQFGRKALYLALLAGGLAATVLLSAAQSAVTYALAIFLIGFLLKPTGIIGYLLLQEEVPERLWSPLTATLNVANGFVNLILALVGGTLAKGLSWRTETLLWHIPFAIVLLAGPLLLKESPYFAKAPPQAALPGRGCLSDLFQTGPLQQLFWSRTLRIRLIATIPCWLACVVGFYGISYSAGSLSHHLYTNLALFALADIISFALASPIIQALGSRKAQMLAFFTAMLCFIVCACLPAGPWRVAVAMIGRFGLDVSFATVYLLAMSCFPAECRGTAIGLANFFARISAVVTPLFSLMPVPACCLLMSGLSLLASSATWVLPESPGCGEEEQKV